MNRHCRIYIICRVVNGQLSQPVKIGISDSPIARLAQLQTGSPHKLVIVRSFACRTREFAQKVEGFIHGELKSFRDEGEWFRVDPIDAIMFVSFMLAHQISQHFGIKESEAFNELELSSIPHAIRAYAEKLAEEDGDT